MTNTANLVSLVGSRLCHDLISPVGAMQNGLELLSMTEGGADTPEMALIQDSCASAAARIRFFRVAFGAASAGQSVGAKDARATLQDYALGSRVQTAWKAGTDMPRDRVQLAFLAFLCCESALPAGGMIQCDAEGDRITVSATAPRIKIDPEAWGTLDGSSDMAQITPDLVQFALLATLAADRGVAVNASAGEAGVQIQIG